MQVCGTLSLAFVTERITWKTRGGMALLNLIIAVLSSTCVSLVMRWSEAHVSQKGGMLAVNYLTLSLIHIS